MTKEEFLARQEEIKRIMLGYKQNITYAPGKSAGLMTSIDPVISRLPEIKSSRMRCINLKKGMCCIGGTK